MFLAGLGASIRREALRLTGSSVFAILKGENRVELFKRLVKLAVASDAVRLLLSSQCQKETDRLPFAQRVAPDVLACIRLAKADTETVTALFNDIRTSFSGSTAVTKGPKRGRTSIG